MSAIGGIINFNDRPSDSDLLTTLWKALADRGPDGGDMVTDGMVGICYRAFHTNRESRLERQPFVSRSNCVLALDGRIDNRNELIGDLRDQLRGERATI